MLTALDGRVISVTNAEVGRKSGNDGEKVGVQTADAVLPTNDLYFCVTLYFLAKMYPGFSVV